MSKQDGPRVLLVVLTFRRPDDLGAILPLLVAQSTAVPHTVDLLVVDNDPEASARTAVTALASDSPVTVSYAHEAVPGIVAARNRALDEAVDYDILVFIDDDERPRELWLSHLLATWEKYGSAAVVGPVISEYAQVPERWISEGRFFERRRLATGTELSIAATNNLLLDLSVIRRLDLRFDTRFALTGGSDTLFSRQIHASGAKMIWCDEAIVVDVVPESRLTRKWVLQRAFRSGNSLIRTSLVMAPNATTRLRVRGTLAVRGGARVAGGLVMAAAGLATGSIGRRARGVRTVARGAGIISGAVGTVYSEYKRT